MAFSPGKEWPANGEMCFVELMKHSYGPVTKGFYCTLCQSREEYGLMSIAVLLAHGMQKHGIKQDGLDDFVFVCEFHDTCPETYELPSVSKKGNGEGGSEKKDSSPK